MVFFTCNSCGQCVKKIHVEKHYLTECRNCEVLSCMDCGKDFFGDEYKHHTKCISENEKYGGKDYVASAKLNKGEVKQSQWIQCVQAASTSQSLSPRLKGLLERLADYSNIPRKKVKFERFVQNSLKVYDNKLIEQIWTIFSEASSKQKNQPVQKAEEGTRQETENTTQENGLANSGSSEEQSEDSKGDKKKKKKDKSNREMDIQSGGEMEQVESRLTKKEKKKRKKEDHGHEIHEDGVGEENIDEKDIKTGDAKKKKKKHKRVDQEQKGLNEIPDVAKETGNVEAEPSKKAKKKKHNKHDGQESNRSKCEKAENGTVESEETGHGVDTTVSKKSKKKKDKKHKDAETKDMAREGLLDLSEIKKKKKRQEQDEGNGLEESSELLKDGSNDSSEDGSHSDGKKKRKHDKRKDSKVSEKKVKKRKQNGDYLDGKDVALNGSAAKKKKSKAVEIESETKLKTKERGEKKKKNITQNEAV